MLNYTKMEKFINKQYTNNSTKDCYALTYNNYPYTESIMIMFLNLSMEEYVNIIKKCGGKFIRDGFYFIEENDAIKAVITLKLMAA